MRDPLPKELVRLAWKAKVGYSWDKTATQRFWWEIAEKGQLQDTRMQMEKKLRKNYITYRDPCGNEVALV